ncbi:MAG: hypothetical protein K1W18_06985 [Oscillospiraceae bacterium]
MTSEVNKPEIFEVKATRYQRCGGILLSEFGLKNGMGHVCKRKADAEAAAAKIDENQITLFASEDNKEETYENN